MKNNQKSRAVLEAGLANNAMQYDLVPYESKPFTQSQPSRLAAIAKIFGLASAPLSTARVLELGCASGGNILPLALQHPKAQFVGIDISRQQVATGRARIEKLGLKNIELQCKSLTELDQSLGEFDYIIAHGVYSWVPEEVQDAILEIASKHLSENGLAYVSYNVLPGWRINQPLRDAFLSLLPETMGAANRLANALDMAQFLKAGSAGRGAYGQAVATWADQLGQMPPDYIAHEYLEPCNEPCTFVQFANRVAANGLAYLGDSDFHTMILEHLPPTIVEGVRQRCGNNLQATEQMMDLLSGRTFRQSILVNAKRAGAINRNLSADVLDDLHLMAPSNVTLTTQDGITTFTLAGRQSFTITSEAMKKAIQAFVDNHPASSRVADLAKKADLPEVKQGFYALLLAGAVVPLIEPVAKAKPAPKQPVASGLARLDAESPGGSYTTSPRHEAVQLDVASRFLLPKMQGKLSQDELADALAAEGRAGRIVFTREGKVVESPDDAASIAKQHAKQLIDNFAKLGLLAS